LKTTHFPSIILRSNAKEITVYGDIFGITDVLDILIVAFIVYKVLGFIRETRAEQLAKGLLILVIITLASKALHLYTLNWILSGLMTVGVVALVVIFQPELRRALEHLGRSRFVNVLNGVDKEEAKRMVLEMVEAIDSMSSSRTGALIVIEGEITLNDIVETGTVIDAAVSAEMIGNIFYEGAPLHDGALIIRGDRLHAAGCVLPLTQNKQLSKELGTRHRAGIGITENSDAMVIIVSEETGVISIAQNGNLTRFVDVKKIEKTLLGMYFDGDRKYTFTERINMILRGGKNAEK
jgi:diadenylate cyclase